MSSVSLIFSQFFRERLTIIEEDSKQSMIVIEDKDANRICACGTLTVEPKFIHEGGLVGHIEDVVVIS